MTEQLFNTIKERRETAKKSLQTEFDGAKTPSDLLKAYARYAGRLEAILDTIEIRSIGEGIK